MQNDPGSIIEENRLLYEKMLTDLHQDDDTCHTACENCHGNSEINNHINLFSWCQYTYFTCCW